MVTPEPGSLTLVGAGGSRSISLYISDVAAAYVTMSLTGVAVAGSDNQYIAQADGVIRDFSWVTGCTVAVGVSVLINGVATGNILDKTAFVSTAATRPPLAIPFKKGDKIQLVQV